MPGAPRDGLPVLVAGASGFVGRALVARLEGTGRPLRCMTRRPERLRPRVGPATEVVPGDVEDVPSLDRALAGVGAACYLVHSMAAGPGYRAADRRGAAAFASSARRAGVGRVVYLGGLGHGPGLSEHLAGRHEVGAALRAEGVPVVEIRASIIIDPGGTSFEMVRSLVDRLPAMVTPRWVDTPTQPIALEDVVEVLVEALDMPLAESRVVEVGGPDRISYRDLMREYARLRGLRRPMLRVPALSPRLSGLWLALVTPVQARVGRELVEGLRNPTVVRDPAAQAGLRTRPRGVREALARAIEIEDRGLAARRWSEALDGAPRRGPLRGAAVGGRRLVDSRAAAVPVPPDRAFAPVRRIGGRAGWYHADGLWILRGLLDRAVGGVGVRRDRRDPEELRPGDVVGPWRVEAVEPGRLLRLEAEMRLPGRAWLQFEVTPSGGGSLIRQTAILDPRGLAGRLYWYGLWPVHALVFRGLLRGLARAAGREPWSAG